MLRASFPRVVVSGLSSLNGFKKRLASATAVASILLPVCGHAIAQVPITVPSQVAVGRQSAAMPVLITMTAAGAGASTAALVQGTPNMDFSIVPGTACDSSASYQVGSQCTVSVVFTPKFPGQRRGAVVVTSSTGQLLGSTQLVGNATGSLSVLTFGDVNTVAGNGQLLYQGDGQVATSAAIYLPQGVVANAAGDLYISDTQNNRIRLVQASTGIITTFAGTGSPGYSGDGGPATAAQISQPAGLTLDGAGNIYFADSGNDVVRRIDAVSGVITTVAGTPLKQGYAGDAAAATQARLSDPRGVAFDPAGDLVIADTGNNVVRLISAATGTITTIAGTGVPGYNGDGIPATTALLFSPWSVAYGPDGLLYIADLSNNRIRKVNAAGVISTAAGTGFRGFAGNGGPATSAFLNDPAAIAFNPAGDLYIADSGNDEVRRVSTSGIIQTFAGTGSEQFEGDKQPADQAGFYAPYALYFDQAGNLFISDMLHNRIREVAATPVTMTYPDIRVSKTSAPQIQQVENDGNDNLLLGTPAFVNAALDSSTTTCSFGMAISPDGNCNLGVEFQPTVIGSPVSGSVTLPSNAGNSATVMNISGNVLSVNPVTISLTSSLNPSLLNAAVTFTATISSDDPNISGPVTFLDGTTTLCSNVPLTSGTATCTTSSLALGQHNMTASYAGDANNEAKVSAVLVQIVQQTPTVALTATPNPTAVTTSVGLTVSVTAATGTPTGTVTFYSDGAAISGALMLNNGSATFSTSTLTPGGHTLTAQYAGDTNDAAATSNAVAEVINQATTTTTLGSSNGTAYVGTSVTFTATVTSAIGATLNGTIQFTEGTTVLGSVKLGSNGMAALPLSSLAPGTHSIVATYSGDTNDAGSSSAALLETIQQIPTATTLTSDAGTLSAGASVHLTATVAISGSAPADGTSTGLVTFTDGSSTLGAVQLGSNGQATLTVNLPAGAQSIVATYAGDTNYAGSTSSPITETVNTTATTTSLSGSSPSSLSGKPVTFTATVASSTAIPTGSVTFMDGVNAIGSSPLTQGVATLTTSTLFVGTHVLTAIYNGDANYVSSKSASFTEVVSLATTSVSLAGPPKVEVATAVTLTGTLSSNGVTPTGPLTLLDGSTALQTLNAPASGSFSFSTSSLSIGTHMLIVSYAGDSNNANSVSPVLTIVVRQATTTTSLASSSNPATLGQPVTLTSTVTSDGAGITGSVSFYDGATLIGSVGLTNGTASFTTSTLPFGSQNLTAVYSGDANHSTSTSPVVAEQIVQAAAAALTSSANPATSGTNVVFTATLTGVGSLVPTGSVTFRDGGNVLAVVALGPNGTATFQSSMLAVGSHNITFSYPGDTNYAAASGALTETILNANTQIALTASANPATYGTPLSLVATITSNGGIATGSVTFTEGGVPVGSAVLNGNAVATLTTSTLAPGVHSIVANYAGDGKASASASTPLTITVLQNTTTALTTSANPASTLAPITLTASVTNSVGAATGIVVFTDGTTQLGSVKLSGNVATLTVPSLSAGTHALTASYSGDGNNFPSSANLTQTVQLRATTTTLTSSQNDPTNMQSVTLISVVHYSGATPATGTITFTSGSTTLGSAQIDATGVATLNIVVQAGTTEQVVAAYSGDAAYATSGSAAAAISSGQVTQFTLSLNPSTMTLPSTQHGTATLTMTSVKNFADTMDLGCLGLPFAATCTFSTTQAKLGANGTTTVQVTVDTGNPLGAGTSTGASMGGTGRTLLLTLPLTLLLSFGLLASGRKRRKLTSLLLLAFAAALTLTATGCAGLSTNGTPAGTYTFYVTATGHGTGATQSQAVTLTVTQ